MKGDFSSESIEEIFVYLKNSESFEEITRLFRIFFIIQTNSVEAERCFSKISLIKTNSRNSLNEIHLCDLLRITYNNILEEKIDFYKIYEFWLKKAEKSNQRSNLISKN